MQKSTQTFIEVSAADSLVGDKMPAFIPLMWEEINGGYSNSYAIMLEREQLEVWNNAIMAEFGEEAGFKFDGDILVVDHEFDADWLEEERRLLGEWGIPDASTIEPVTIVMEADGSERVVYFVHGGFVVYVE
jgi:hypothetical protein